MEKLFWSQFGASKHPLLLNEQLVKLHKVAEQAMKGFIVRLWPGEALPGSYFGLVWRLVEACPRLEVIKRSVCIEGTGRLRGRSIASPRTTIRMFLRVPALWQMNVPRM